MNLAVILHHYQKKNKVKIIRVIVFLLFVQSGWLSTEAQNIPGTLSDRIQISIITVGPAAPLYTAFGHSAIRLQDPKRGIDIVYNYGTYDFESDGFYWEFARGDLRYFLSKTSFETFERANRQLGRSIREQVLNLEVGQVRGFVRELEKQLLPENRYYPYKFFNNNCVTKIRDLLVEQGILRPPQFNATSSATYRQLLEPYLASKPWTSLGVNLLLGPAADQPINAWQQQFLPNQLWQSLASAHVLFTDQPIVGETNKISKASVTTTSSVWVQPVFVFWILFAGVAVITWQNVMSGGNSFWVDRILFGGTGLLGIVLLFLWMGSQHVPLQNNWNLLWALPTHLVIAFGVYQRYRTKWFEYYLWLSLLSNTIVLAGWNVIPQQFPSAAFPIVLAMELRLAFMLFKKQELEFLA